MHRADNGLRDRRIQWRALGVVALLRFDADQPVEDRFRALIERGQIEEIALRAPSVDTLEAVDVDALVIAGGDETEELHDRAVALDVRLDPDLGPALAREHVEAP